MRYRITTTVGEVIAIDNPTKFPDPSEIKQIEEPIVSTPPSLPAKSTWAACLKLLEDKRGNQKKFEYLGGGRVMLT